ncbi:46 kDa FK506-binding nuclear protein isoform X1 [Vanessa tameamea]|uniref:FK506-binding protein n=1 Tax=Vanessa tameamea TaxID=334116 RepID=A0A8B8I7P5_VANTA
MFWGLIMEPNKRYSQVVEKPFHISQAAMDISTGDNDPCQVMIVVDGKNFLVCTLQKNKTIQVPLDLYFKAGDSISFLTNGKCNVHLTGYLDPEFEEEPSDEEEEEEEEEEAPALVPAKNKRKLENSNEGVTNKKAKQNKKTDNKPAAAAESSDEDEDGEDQLQKFLDGEDIDTDDNDESFKVNTSTEATDSDEESDEEDEDDEDDDDNEDESSEKADTTLDTSKDDSTADMSKLTKSQKRRLKKKLQKQKEPQVNGVEKTKKEKPAEQPQKAEKKKPEAKKDAQEGDKKEKKSLSGGVFIEDLKVGNGAVAKPGKVVMVYYEGRLKQNNKMFDNCQKGPGFKFKLGAKEVISGWDVGVAGMKVGGKRKIVCPPAMAYGAKGSPPVIPPNSSLVFEVELKNVK